MSILDLAHNLNLLPIRTANTHGGEYKSKCPKCQDGKDRFCIWPNQGQSGRYWCRVCDTKGDAIQFCRDFLGMTFQEACEHTGMVPGSRILKKRPPTQVEFIPQAVAPVCVLWQQAAARFIETSHRNLLNHPEAIDLLTKRGITLDTAKRFSIGWNEKDIFEDREEWGVSPERKTNGSSKRQWLPKGIVIPTCSNGIPVKLKIRRSDWTEADALPKYVEVSGSQASPSIYGNMSKPVMIVESELDAMLIQQCAAHLICCMALGGVTKKPDYETHMWLQKAPLILLSLDFDEPGKKRSVFWIKLYPNLRSWPAPHAKSPGDAFKNSHSAILNWVCGGF